MKIAHGIFPYDLMNSIITVKRVIDNNKCSFCHPNEQFKPNNVFCLCVGKFFNEIK